MIKEPQVENRILYDNLSHFSIELNKVNSIADIQLILQSHIKHLFSCCVCRITYFQQHNFVCYTISSETSAAVKGTHQLLWDVEKLLFYEGLPLRLNASEYGAILRNIPCKHEADKLWGWKLNYSDDAGILLTILADEQKPFLRKHIPLVKMISEMLFTKIRLILLLQAIQKNEADLALTNGQREDSHAIINEPSKVKEKKVEENTFRLSQLNKDTTNKVQFDTHNIREPLMRLMDVMQLKSAMSNEEFLSNCWPIMVTAVHDLDNRLRAMV